MHVTAIIAAAGSGTRAGGGTPKQWLDIGGRSMLALSVAAFDTHPRVTDLVVVVPPGSDDEAAEHVGAPPRVRVVAGGPRRQDSVANGFDAVPPQADVVLIHDAARPFVSADLIGRTIDAAAAHGAAIAALPAHDTVKRATATQDEYVIVETIPRETIFLAQTPQGFRRDVLSAAIAVGRSGVDATDEAALAERAGYAVHLVPGDPGNVKVTTEADVASARRRATDAAVAPGRVGTGYDLH